MLKKILYSVIYISYLSIFIVVGTELGLRIYFDDPQYWWEFRYLYTSYDAFVNKKSVRAYKPNSDIRITAVYGFPAPGILPAEDFRIAYDCRFKTNRFGLQGQDEQFDENIPTVLILGDSFTEGHGGCPWVHLISGNYKQFNILNGGIQGTGVESFARLYRQLVERGVDIIKVVMIVISDDFKRWPFRWKYDDLACLADRSACAGHLWYPAGLNESRSELIALSKERAGHRHKELAEISKLNIWLMRHSYFFAFGSRAAYKYFGSKGAGSGSARHSVTPNNIAGLKLLLSADVDLEVILVPQRDEVALRQLNIDNLQIKETLTKYSVSSSWCNLSQGDYLKWDGHPNAQGYKTLAGCLERTLDEFESK